MVRLLLVVALLLPGLAVAQPRPFSCAGAERLEDDVFAIPFATGSATPGDTARANLDAAAALAEREGERKLCVLGHAARGEGEARAGVQLAARRAGAVAQLLASRGVARDRIRAEARRANYARGVVPAERSVTVVVMPSLSRMP
jgi:outer membrane protein OmpA-like peptidoglycan-associated protein